MKPRYTVRVTMLPIGHKEFENFGMLCKRHGFHWSDDGSCAVQRAGNDLQTLTAETDALRADLKVAGIDVRRIKITETILDVEAE